jgi:integrase
MTTFAEQAKTFLTEGSTRAKRPFRPNTIKSYKSHIETINPLIGDKPLEDVTNKLLKAVCEELQGQEYSAKTINDILVVIKQIVKSAVDSEGNFLYPREWNSKFIDAPSIENQKQPTVTAETLQEAIRRAIPQDKALYALLAGTGLRINEALGIVVFDDGKSNFITEGVIHIRSQRGGDAPKTKSGVRQVDLAPELQNFIRENARPEGNLLFPESESTYRERLEKNGILGGFHTLRRFRISHLQSVSVPGMLIKFWNGHAAGDITERYTKVGSEIQARKEQAAKAGLGFKLETI